MFDQMFIDEAFEQALGRGFLHSGQRGRRLGSEIGPGVKAEQSE